MNAPTGVALYIALKSKSPRSDLSKVYLQIHWSHRLQTRSKLKIVSKMVFANKNVTDVLDAHIFLYLNKKVSNNT